MSDALERYLRDVHRYPVWTPDEERAAGARLVAARRGACACGIKREVDRFVRHNLRLVVALAQRFQRPGVSLLDLIQDGNMGLMVAATKFDPELGFRFSTYVTWWIRQAIARGIACTAETIRVPVHAGEARRVVSKARARFLASTGRQPTRDELARAARVSASKVARVEELPATSLSLDVRLDDGDTLLDVIADAGPSALDELLAGERIEQARRLTASLPQSERDVVRERFSDEEPTLDEVGARRGVSRERVRQIQVAGLERLRAAAMAP